MTTEVGDGWKYWEGIASYVHKCAVCGKDVEINPFYKGKITMHRECFSDWTNKGRPELQPTSPAADASKSLGNAPSSAPAAETGITYQLGPKVAVTRGELEDLTFAVLEVARAVREQTTFLRDSAVPALTPKVG